MKKSAFNIMKGSGITLLNKITGNTTAYTVISPVSKTLKIQRDKAVMPVNVKMDLVVDGYAVLCTNQDEQYYIYSKNTKGETLTLEINNNEWVVKDNSDIEVIPGRREYQNFCESIGTSYEEKS